MEVKKLCKKKKGHSSGVLAKTSNFQVMKKLS